MAGRPEFFTRQSVFAFKFGKREREREREREDDDDGQIDAQEKKKCIL